MGKCTIVFTTHGEVLHIMAEWLLSISSANPHLPLEMDLELESRRSRLLQRLESSVCTASIEEIAGDGMPDTAEMDEATLKWPPKSVDLYVVNTPPEIIAQGPLGKHPTK